MQGLELCRRFYHNCGEPMLRQQFPELLPLIAVGIAGSGSECYGYDDEISRDHDFEPGFCIFLPGEDSIDRPTAFRLERAYAKLPKEYGGFLRSTIAPVGGQRHGVFRIEDFCRRLTGLPSAPESLEQWLSIPEYALCEATNGEIFYDGPGTVTALRGKLSAQPEDLRRKKLAGQLLLMGQAGQYNYRRCLGHGEPEAARLAVGEFVRAAMAAIFLLNRRYMPYYKWSFRTLRSLPLMSELAAPLGAMLTGSVRQEDVEKICHAVADALRQQGLSSLPNDEMERHAYAVNDKIQNPELRNANILLAV